MDRRRLLGVGAGLAAGAVAGTAEAKPRPRPRTHVKTLTDGVGLRDYQLVVGPPPVGNGPIVALPPQPGSVVYGSPVGSFVSDYGHPGGLVLAGRDQYDDPEFEAVSAGGGHVLIYLDAIVWNTTGRYHDRLFNSSAEGAAVPKWPGPVSANGTGDLADFRVGGVLQGKLAAVLELMVSENPHMAGFFMDDVGSRSWFPNFSWESFGTTNQNDYRAGAIAICETVREVCDNHGLIFMVNGTWTGLFGLTFVERGGGYPDMENHGMSLAEGGCVEHHDGSAFWAGYMNDSTQWGNDSPVTNGKPFCFVIASSAQGVTDWRNDNRAAWISNQPSGYTGVAPWGTVEDFHPTGLPSSV